MHDGEQVEYRGIHQPMITEDEFWRVQKLLGLPVPKPKSKDFAYKRLIRCGECGCGITAEEHVKKSGRRYVHYHCTKKKRDRKCGQPTINEKDLTSQLKDILDTITLPAQFVTWAKIWLRYLNEQETDHGAKTRESLQAAYNGTQGRIDRLTNMRIDDLLTEDEFKAKRQELLNERDSIKAKLDDTEQAADNWIERVEGVLDFAQGASERFRKGDLETKREVLTALGSNFLLKDRKVSVELEKVWSIFSKEAPLLRFDMERLELDENGDVNEKTTAFTTVFPRWQGRRESNPQF